ncbi:MAG: hypothetical protein RL158_1059, partial [Bacteroidota bacterium]
MFASIFKSKTFCFREILKFYTFCRQYLYPMSKAKSAFFCNNCGYESTKWVGKCPACNEWNSFTEELIDAGKEKEAGWDGY